MKAEEFKAWRQSIPSCSQRIMAKSLGVHRNSICDWERGATPIPPSISKTKHYIDQVRILKDESARKDRLIAELEKQIQRLKG